TADFGALANVELSGLTSSDPDGDPLTYTWYNLDESDVNPFFGGTALGGGHPYGWPMRLRLVVTDPSGATGSDDLSIVFDAAESVHLPGDPYYADILAVAWTHDGANTQLRLEGADDLTLPAPGTEP